MIQLVAGVPERAPAWFTWITLRVNTSNTWSTKSNQILQEHQHFDEADVALFTIRIIYKIKPHLVYFGNIEPYYQRWLNTQIIFQSRFFIKFLRNI